MVIPKPLLIAGGFGLAGGAALLFLNKDKAKDGADPASKDPAAAGTGGLAPTAGTPAGGVDPATGLPTGGAATGGLPGAGAGGVQGQQIGPYTVVADPASGQQVVFETATQQPVGVLDAQGNLLPLDGGAGTTGGQGTIVPEGPGLTPTGPGGVTANEGPGLTPTAGVPQAQQGQDQFAAIAKDLFASAGNGSVGAASSDSMAGVASLAPRTGVDAGATGSSAPAALGASSVGTTSGATMPAGAGQITSQQMGAYTVLDDGSGVKVILETATQQPVGVMDATGAVTPISVDAAGNIQMGDAPSGAASGAAALTAPSASTVTSPATITSPALGASPLG